MLTLPPPSTENAEAATASGNRVLLVEDDHGDAHVFGRLLARMPGGGADVVHCATLGEARGVLAEDRAFRAVLLDLGLPDSDGLDGLAQLRNADIPIVVLTGHDDLELAAAAVGEGAQDYLTKHDLSSQKLHRSLLHAIQRHETQRQLLAAHEREQVLKDNVLSHVSHELRTPLTAVAAFVDILREGSHGPVNAKQAEFLAIVDRNVRQLKRMIGDLMDMARIGTGKLTLEPGLVDLKSCVADVVDAASAPAAEKGLDLDIDLAGALPFVIGDQARVTQVLQNLVDNAVKFTSSGGRVVVRAERGDDDMTCVTVEDTGCGIAEDHLGNLFERLAQDDSSTSGSRRGLGLGLWLTRELVRSMDGWITVDSKPGVGSRFRVHLPIYTIERLVHRALGGGQARAISLIHVHLGVAGRRGSACRPDSARREASRCLQRCLVASTDTLVPEIVESHGGLHVFALVRTDATGAAVVARRIAEEFGDPTGRLTSCGYRAEVEVDTISPSNDRVDPVTEVSAAVRRHLEAAATKPAR